MGHTTGHPWRAGKKGRFFGTREGGVCVATLTCQQDGCTTSHDIKFHQLAHSDQMDRKFIQAGWILDPARCPEHKPKRKERPMTTTSRPSPAAIKGQARMFGLLQTHFDVESGTFSPGWSDEKIATECGLATDLVVAVRIEAFGALQEPPEVRQLHADIATVEGLLAEEEGRVRSIREMVEGLKIKAADLKKRFAG